MLIAHLLLFAIERNSRIYPNSTVLPSSPDVNPADYSVWEILRDKVYKTRITDLDKLNERLRTE